MRDKDKTATRWQTKRNRYDNLPMVVFFLFSSRKQATTRAVFFRYSRRTEELAIRPPR
jgi:hypothetical protein